MIEFVIKHDGVDWVIENRQLRLARPTLEALDADVGEALKQRGMLAEGDACEVLMTFDNATIPEWMRPYAQHYFNRMIIVQG
jgi:hypothetical protein